MRWLFLGLIVVPVVFVLGFIAWAEHQLRDTRKRAKLRRQWEMRG